MFELIIFVLLIALIHTIGEIIYKIGSKNYFLSSNKLSFRSMIGFFFQKLVVISLSLSLISRIMFGFAIQNANFSVAPAIYLAFNILLSQVGGYFFFSEEITKTQFVGFISVTIGIFLIGGTVI